MGYVVLTTKFTKATKATKIEKALVYIFQFCESVNFMIPISLWLSLAVRYRNSASIR
jgi:hypothetical protein